MTTAAAMGLEHAEPEKLRVMTIQRAITDWLGDLALKNHSERTIKTYDAFLTKLALYLPDVDAHEVTSAHVRRFLESQSRRKDGRRKTAATLGQQVSILNGFFDWLKAESIVQRNPTRRNEQRILSRPRQMRPEDNDAVKTISGDEARRILTHVDEKGSWPEKLAIYLGVYTGARRQALSRARVRDYDVEAGIIWFYEKGRKPIEKPVPPPLERVIHAAADAGVWETEDDYLIPSPAYQKKPGQERDARIIWKIVRGVMDDAKVRGHVHSLRAAYATQYLETHPGNVYALKKLMGHSRIETTEVYLRRLDRRHQMETGRDLDFFGATDEGRFELPSRVSPTNALAGRRLQPLGHSSTNPHFGSELLGEAPHESSLDTQPSFAPTDLLMRVRPQCAPVVPGKELV